MLIHFVCRGNCLRSFIADTYLKSLEIDGVSSYSSGTVADLYREQDLPFFQNTTRILKGHGLGKYLKPRAEQLTQERLDNADLTIFINEIVYSEAKENLIVPKNYQIWDIVDIGERGRESGLENGRPTEEVIYDEITAKVSELAREKPLFR
jgi:protein-tyrosine-phosphatase